MYIEMSKSSYRTTYSFEDRKKESERILSKYPDRIPIICETRDKDKLVLDKHKYLVQSDTSVGQFIYVLRKRLKLKPEEAIFMFINNALPPTSELLQKIYQEQRDEDGFLYCVIASESTFG